MTVYFFSNFFGSSSPFPILGIVSRLLQAVEMIVYELFAGSTMAVYHRKRSSNYVCIDDEKFGDIHDDSC